MRNLAFYKGVFAVAAAYDLVLGVVFLFLYPWVYGVMGIALPTEPAYLETSAAFVLVQGFMYILVYRNVERNRDLILVAVIYKLAYAAISLYHFGLGDLPHTLFAVSGFLDLGFVVLFVLCLRALKSDRGVGTPAAA